MHSNIQHFRVNCQTTSVLMQKNNQIHIIFLPVSTSAFCFSSGFSCSVSQATMKCPTSLNASLQSFQQSLQLQLHQGNCVSVLVCECVPLLHTIRTWTRFPVVEFHTFRVRLLAAVITVLSWRSHATMVTLSLVTLSSSGGGLYFLRGGH